MVASVCPKCTASVPVNEDSCGYCGTYFEHDKVDQKVEMFEMSGNSNTIRRDNVIVHGNWNKIYGDNVIVSGNSNEVAGKWVTMTGNWNDHYSYDKMQEKPKKAKKEKETKVALVKPKGHWASPEDVTWFIVMLSFLAYVIIRMIQTGN